MDDRLNVNPRIGDAICTLIEKETGRWPNIILIMFPSDVETPQPTFISNFEPEIMEDVIEQLGEQMDNVRDSRVVDAVFRKKDMN